MTREQIQGLLAIAAAMRKSKIRISIHTYTGELVFRDIIHNPLITLGTLVSPYDILAGIVEAEDMDCDEEGRWCPDLSDQARHALTEAMKEIEEVLGDGIITG